MRLSRRGTEPITARSPYGLRKVLALVALIAGVIGAVAFGLAASRSDGTAAGEWVVAALCAFVALTGAVDLLVIGRRR